MVNCHTDSPFCSGRDGVTVLRALVGVVFVIGTSFKLKAGSLFPLKLPWRQKLVQSSMGGWPESIRHASASTARARSFEPASPRALNLSEHPPGPVRLP